MAVEYNRIRVSGTMPGGEVWSINPAFANADGGAVEEYSQLQQWANSIALLNTNRVLPASVMGILSSSVSITEIRAEYYDTTGKLATVAETTLTTPQAGTNTANKPYQVACVASLLTGRPGRSYRGRLYLPALAATIDSSTLRMSPVLSTALATDMGIWLRAVSNAPGALPLVDPVVVSQTLGIASFVTQVSVGNVLDTQRRRRDAAIEAYSTVNIPG